MEVTIQDMVKVFETFDNSYSFDIVFSDWVEACAISIQNIVNNPCWEEREKRYNDLEKKYTKDDWEKFPQLLAMLTTLLNEHITDVLGELYMAGNQGNKKSGQFFTPFHLSELTAALEIANYNITENKPISVQEPSCGSCGMIIGLANQLKSKGINYQSILRVKAQDIDWRCVYMSYIQLSLLGIDAIVVQGDTLGNAKIEDIQIFKTPKHLGILL